MIYNFVIMLSLKQIFYKISVMNMSFYVLSGFMYTESINGIQSVTIHTLVTLHALTFFK